MASLIDELIDVLDKEEKEYQDLILLSREKTPVIVKGDLDKLQKITEAEQYVVGRVTKLEKKRIEVTKDIAIVLGKDEESIKVVDIIDLLQSQLEVQEKLIEVNERLKKTMQEIKLVNDMNKSLIQESLDFIEFNLNLVRGVYQEPGLGNYTKNACNTPSLDSPGVFDAKQ